MKTIPLHLDPTWDCEIFGQLHESDDVRELSQDMLELHLPSGLTIEAGWSPENDPHGGYEIHLCRGSEVSLSFTRETAIDTKLLIEELAEKYSGQASRIAKSE